MSGSMSPSSDGQRSGMLPYKRSQRPSWSCTECARRKIKCDKKIPCQSCIKRGRSDQCKLEGSSGDIASTGAGPSALLPAIGKQEPTESMTGFRLATSNLSSPRPSASAVGDKHGMSSAITSSLTADPVSHGLLLLQKQLDRIEDRLARIDRREDSLEDLTARVSDVEEVISILGEQRSRLEQMRASSSVSPLKTTAAHTPTHTEGLATSERPTWTDLDAVAANGERLKSRLETNLSKSKEKPAESEAWGEVRNAELESRDAATTLEFLTLGKDRRQGIGLDESSDSEGDGEALTRGDGDRQRKSDTNGRHNSGSQKGEGGRTAQAMSVHENDERRLLKHLRRGLPSEVLNRIELVLRSQPGDLPPSNLLARPATRSVTKAIKAVDLSSGSIRKVVEIAKEIGAWQHCCVHFPTFEREVEAFLAIAMGDLSAFGPASMAETPNASAYEGWKAIDPAWMALFFVICSIAIHQMSPEEGARCALNSESERSRLASLLLHAAMDSLSLADYLVKPSVYSCQTIAILCVAGHNICGSDLLTSLLAIGIKTGQTLNLHALGRTAGFLETCAARRNDVLLNAGIHAETSGSCRLPDETPKQFAVWKKRIIDLEVGKRVWWAFTQQDYFAIPFSGCFSIVEGQYDTPLPHNCSDEDLEEGRLINREVDELTVASKQRFTCHVAKIVCDFFEDLNKTKDIPSLSLVRHHEQRLRFVTDRFRACLRPRRDAIHTDRPGLPSFTSVLQHYLYISVQHKILVMHRAFLSRNVSREERELSHAASIETARAVLHELERGLGLNSDGDDRPQLDLQSRVHGGALWTIPYHSVAAATILALDMFKSVSPNMSKTQLQNSHETRSLRRQEVKRAMDALSRFTKKSAIARRGHQLLADLLEESKRFDRRMGRSGGKRKAEDGVDLVMKRIRLPGNDDAPLDQTNDVDTADLKTTEPNTAEPMTSPSTLPSPESRRGGGGEQGLEARWFEQFSKDSVLSSDMNPGSGPGVLGEPTPDDQEFSPLPTASYGYGSSHFNPLAGNSTSRNVTGATLQQIGAPDSLSSMFLSSEPNLPGSNVGYGFYPTSNPNSIRGGEHHHSANLAGYDLPSSTTAGPTTSSFRHTHSRSSTLSHREDSTSGGPHNHSHVASQGPAPSAAPASSWENGGTWMGTHHHGGFSNGASAVDLNVPQQQLAHILPALESMPDVWKLFDGTLGQNLVAFEESGF